ncbi:MAG: hypothetical protein HOO06_15255 [Bdellovibrionaceae bacterium]|jgi:hypothetical protein|nr:hypothetical protein [Pseudobdellovibrionaceae bacterium]
MQFLFFKLHYYILILFFYSSVALAQSQCLVFFKEMSIGKPVEQSTTINGEKSFLIPYQIEGSTDFIFSLYDAQTSRWVQHKVDYPQGTKNRGYKRGLRAQTEHVIWLNFNGSYAIRANIKIGTLKKKKNEVLLVFSKRNKLKAVVGLRLDSDYQIGEIFQDKLNPQIMDVNFHHKKYLDTVVERWDLNQYLKVAEKSLYETYVAPKDFHRISFNQNSVKVSAEKSDFGKAHEIKSPNGKYTLRMTLAHSGDSIVGEANAWAIDIVRVFRESNSKRPVRYALLESLPMEVDFSKLQIYWHNRGESVVIQTNGSQVWLWNSVTKEAEVFIADSFQVENGNLVLINKVPSEEKSKKKIFSLLNNDFIN